jgi:hypothetical protein
MENMRGHKQRLFVIYNAFVYPALFNAEPWLERMASPYKHIGIWRAE